MSFSYIVLGAGRQGTASAYDLVRFGDAERVTLADISAMDRTTGWHLSIVAAMMARGETPIGSFPLESAVPDEAFVREARRRGFNLTERMVM